MSIVQPERAAFRVLSEATPADWAIIDRAERSIDKLTAPVWGCCP